jgi:cell division protease FtsH
MIRKQDIDYAIDRTILGATSRTLNDVDTKRRVAIHESGHALIAALTKPGSVRKATIIPRGEALGYVAPIPKELHLATASELLDQVKMILAGGVAERMYLGEHSIGVGGDVQQQNYLNKWSIPECFKTDLPSPLIKARESKGCRNYSPKRFRKRKC